MTVPVLVKKLSFPLIVLGIPALWFWYEFAGPGYYAEFNRIKRAFREMPEVELLSAGGNQDVTFEDIFARVRIKGKGEVEFRALTIDSFHSSSEFGIAEIGPYAIEYHGEGYMGVYRTDTKQPVRSQFFGSVLDLGSNSAFRSMFPFSISNVQDVISKYDEICSVLSQWPVAPQSQHFRDADGTDYYYSVKKARVAPEKASQSAQVPNNAMEPTDVRGTGAAGE